MRKMSKKDKAENYDKVVRERDNHASLAYFLVNSTGPYGFSPDAVETVTEPNDPGCVHEFRLYACTRANGGILAYIMHSDVNRHASVQAHNFDDWLAAVKTMSYGLGICTEIKIAAERLQRVRFNMFEKLRESA